MSRPKGSKLTVTHKNNISESLKGNKNCLNLHWKWNLESKRKRSEFWKGKSWGTIRWGKGHIPWNKNKKMPKSMSEKISIVASNRVGEKAANWIDGRSFIPYTQEFNNQSKENIRKRYNWICQLCGIKQEDYFQKLSIHHIDYNKLNCNLNNLIPLCRSCNGKVNAKREYYIQYFTNKVIKELGSVLSP